MAAAGKDGTALYSKKISVLLLLKFFRVILEFLQKTKYS